MTQILRLENPLFGRGLKLAQRLCYLNSAAHFLFALPRLVFLMAPLIYLIYGGTNLPGTWQVILAFAAPHLVMLYLTHLRIQGRHRHSFWNEIYETVLAPYVLLPTIGAFLWPRRPKFNVTAKGQVLYSSFFDRRIARPFVLMLFVNFVGLLCAIPRLHLFVASNLPGWQGWLLGVPHRMYDPHHLGTIVMNVAWTLFNTILLGVATAVAWESQQRRRAVRVSVQVPGGVILPDGNVVQGLTGDLSSTGVRLWTGSGLNVQPGDAVRIVLPVLDGDASLPATVVRVEDESLRAQFDALSLAEEEALTMVLYSRADTWLGWDESRQGDHPVRSFARIVRLAGRGLRQTILPGKRARDGGLMPSIVPLLIAAILLPAWSKASGQAATDAAPATVTAPAPEHGTQTAAKTEPAKVEPAKVEPAKAESKKVDGGWGAVPESAASKGTKDAKPTDKPAVALSSSAKKTDASGEADDDVAPAHGSGPAPTPNAPVHSSAVHIAVVKSIVAAVGAPVASAKFVPAAPARIAPAAAVPVAAATAQDTNGATGGSQIGQFYRGRMVPAWWRASGMAAQYPWALLILVVLQTFLIAVLLRASLRRRARERLLGHI
jgi:cellulose synthase (UDP-forming)